MFGRSKHIDKIEITQTVKDKGKITGYICSDHGARRFYSKDEVVRLIQAKLISNAKITYYKGKMIIRVNKEPIKNLINEGTCAPSDRRLQASKYAKLNRVVKY